MGKVIVKNNIGTELSIEHPNDESAKNITTKDFKYIRNTISELSSIGNPTNGDLVLVKGYHSINDSGGGVFVYSSTEPQSNHNGGTIIDSTKEFPDWNDETQKNEWFNTTNSGNGCWIRLFDNVVNVKWFGAKGDGITNDTLALRKARDYSEATNKTFYFEGQFLVTGSIDRIHNVKKIGRGSIKIDTYEFFVDPVEDDSNTIYVSPTGSDFRDGLSPNNAVTIQGAFNILKKYGPVLKGYWTVELAEGTYANVFNNTLKGVKSINRVVIKGADVGGHPNVPTTIIDGTNGTDYEHGIRVGGIGLKVQIQDIKFINFTSNNTRIGLVAEDEVDFYAENVHADNCDWCGVYAFNTVRTNVYGGIYKNCRSGFISNSTQTTFGGADGNPVIVKNCSESGVYWSRGSQGHLDYVKYEDNVVGLLIAENSRVDTIKNEFYRNVVGIRTQTGGVYGEGGEPNIFGTDTNINEINVDYKAFSGDTNELRWSESLVRVAYDRTTYTHSGNAYTVICTPYTLPANRLVGTGKTLKINIYGIFAKATGGSVIKIIVGGMDLDLVIPSAQSNTSFMIEAELLEIEGGYRMFGKIEAGLNGERLGQDPSGFDPTVNNDISIGVQLAEADDSMIIYRTDIYIMG